MPYNIKKTKGGYKVKSPSGFKSKKPMSYRQARQQQKAIYANSTKEDKEE